MAKQILKVNEGGRWFSVQKTDDQYNPYRVYRHSWEMGKYGYTTEHKKCVGKYADMRSAMVFLASQF